MKTIWFIYPYGMIPGENTQEIRYLRFGRELSKKYNCILWTSNYSRRLKKSRSNGFKEIAVQDNLSIMLVPTTPYYKSISLRRIAFELNYARNLRKIWKDAEKPDLIITPGTGMITAFRPVWPYIRDNNVEAVYDIMDVYTFNSYLKYHPYFYPAFRIFDWLNKKREKGFYNRVVGVSSLGRKQLEIAKQRTGNRSIPSRLIYNSIYVDEFRDLMKGSCSIELPEKKGDWIWCIYAGSLNPSYDIPTVVECARKCERNNKKILFAVVGAGEYADLCQKNINDHLLFLGFQDSRVLPPLYAMCDVGLCAYMDSSTVDMPDKFYDYTAAGLAIVNSLKGESRDYVESRGLGVQYKGGDSEDLYEKICRFEDTDYLAECKKNSWNIGGDFDFGKQIDKLTSLIEEII